MQCNDEAAKTAWKDLPHTWSRRNGQRSKGRRSDQLNNIAVEHRRAAGPDNRDMEPDKDTRMDNEIADDGVAIGLTVADAKSAEDTVPTWDMTLARDPQGEPKAQEGTEGSGALILLRRLERQKPQGGREVKDGARNGHERRETGMTAPTAVRGAREK